MKLWQKDKASLKEVEQFTVGNDREMDMYLASFDVLGSLAHTTMLESVGLLTKEDLIVLKEELKNIYHQIAWLYPFTNSDAFVIRTLVWCLCRKFSR